MKKRAFCLFLAAALCLSALCACTAGANGTTSADSSAGVSISTPSKGKNAMSSRLVGISMPEQAGRWEQEATTMQTILQAKDYTVELAYADNNSDTQIEQVKAMLDDDCGAIIVASVDSEALSDALATCDTSNTTMIAYSTLVPDCSTIDYFIGIDSYTNGQIQAKYLVQKLGLKKTKKSFNLEIFHQSNSGSALYAFLGAMDVLKPYLDDSTLVIPSDRTTAEACGVADGAAAKQELSHLLRRHPQRSRRPGAGEGVRRFRLPPHLRLQLQPGEHPAAHRRQAVCDLCGEHPEDRPAGCQDGRPSHAGQDGGTVQAEPL